MSRHLSNFFLRACPVIEHLFQRRAFPAAAQRCATLPINLAQAANTTPTSQTFCSTTCCRGSIANACPIAARPPPATLTAHAPTPQTCLHARHTPTPTCLRCLNSTACHRQPLPVLEHLRRLRLYNLNQLLAVHFHPALPNLHHRFAAISAPQAPYCALHRVSLLNHLADSRVASASRSASTY